MMHKAWSTIEEVPYCFSRSYVKLQGQTAKKIVKFDPNWAFPDCNSSLNAPTAMKCCTKLETAKKKCPIVFQGHPSNFDPNLVFLDYRPVAAFKSLRFALFLDKPLKSPWISFLKKCGNLELGQYHGCWCPGSLHRQDISSHDIDYVKYVGPGLTWGRILSTCVISMWSNDIKCKYMFMFRLENLARKGSTARKSLMRGNINMSFKDWQQAVFFF